MKSNIKVVYQQGEEGIVAITYNGNNIVNIMEWETWELQYLPDNIKYSFGIEDDNNE